MPTTVTLYLWGVWFCLGLGIGLGAGLGWFTASWIISRTLGKIP